MDKQNKISNFAFRKKVSGSMRFTNKDINASSAVTGFAAGIFAAIFYGTNPLGALPLYADGITSGNVLFYRYGLSVAFFSYGLSCVANR